jgi:hypothetical protein
MHYCNVCLPHSAARSHHSAAARQRSLVGWVEGRLHMLLDAALCQNDEAEGECLLLLTENVRICGVRYGKLMFQV